MLKPSPLKHKEGHSMLTEEAHQEAHGGTITEDAVEGTGVETTSAFTSGDAVFNLDDQNQIWTDGEGNVVDDKDVPKEHIDANKKKLQNSVQGGGLVMSDKKVYNPRTGTYNSVAVKKEDKVSENSAIQNAEAFKATEEQTKSAIESANSNTDLAVKQREEFRVLKNKEQGLDANGKQLMLNGRPYIPSSGPPNKPMAGNPNADARYKQQMKDYEKAQEDKKALKLARDTNPMWSYLKKAEEAMRWVEDENGKKIKNPNFKEDATDENIIAEAKKAYLIDQEDKHLQKNVEAWIDKQDGVGVSMPEAQKDEIAKNEAEITKLDAKQKINIQSVSTYSNLYSDINTQMGELKAGFEDKDDIYKGKFGDVKKRLAELGPVDENSSAALIAKYNAINEEGRGVNEEYAVYAKSKTNFIAKFDELEKSRNSYKKHYLNAAKETQEFSENGEDLMAYHNLMNRNGHFLTGIGATIAAATVELASGVESLAAEVVMLPQGLRNDKMLGDNALAQFMVAKADQFETARGGKPILDAKGNWTGNNEKGYKESINKVAESLHNGVQLPQAYDDIETLGDFGEYGANVLANFVPQAAAMSIMGPASLYMMGASAAGGDAAMSRRSNQLGETNYGLGQRIVHALAAGGAEIVTERYTFNLIKGAKQVTKRRISDGFGQAIKKTFDFKNLSKAGSNMIGEGTSEVNATIFGQNAGDILLYGKNKSLFEGIDESFVSGALMERGIAMPGLASRLSQPFRGNRFDSKIQGFEKAKRSLEKEISNPNTSKEVKKGLRDKYLDIQAKEDALIKESHQNVDMMSEKEVDDLIDLDVKLNAIKQHEDNINNDKSLTPAEKESLIKKNRTDEADVLAERNTIVQKHEDPATKEKRVEEYEAQKKVVKAKTAAYNKQQIKNFNKNNSGKRGEVIEFETQEEQRLFFENKKKTQREGVEKQNTELRELLNDPKTSRADKVVIKQIIQKGQADIRQNDQENTLNSSQYGFIAQNKDGGFKIYLNKENSLKIGGNVNVAAHEFLHSALYQTIGGDSDVQKKLGDAVIEYVGNKKGGFSQKFIDKMEPYQGQSNFGEEVITVMSESILDGSLEFNDGFFTKVGDIVRQQLQKYGLKDIKFNTGKDVYNFIKDYNATIEKDYNSKAIDRMMDSGAQGSLVSGKGNNPLNSKRPKREEEVIQGSKEQQSQKVQDIYAKKGEDGAGEIAMEYAGMAEEIFKRNLNLAPSEDIENNLRSNKDDIISEILYSPGTETAKARTVLGLVKDFKSEKHKYQNVAAYINQFLPQRAKEVFAPYGVDMAVTKSMEDDGIMAKAEQIEVKKAAEISKDYFKGHKIHEKLGQGDLRIRGLVKDYQKSVKAKAKNMPIEDVKNMRFKDVQGLGSSIIAEMTGIDAAKLDINNTKQYHANLRKDGKQGVNEQLSAQQFAAKNPAALKIALPKHHTTKLVKTNKRDSNGEFIMEERPHEAVGIPGSILAAYYVKGKRRGNLTPWSIKPNLSDKDFLEPLGVVDRKSFRNDQRKSQQLLSNLATLLDKTMTYQAIKEQKLEEGYTLNDLQTISDGVSEFSFSKAVRGLNDAQYKEFMHKLPLVGTLINPALIDPTSVFELKKILEGVYGGNIPSAALGAIAKDFASLIKRYQNVISNNKTIDEGVWSEFVANTFNQEANNILKMMNLEIDGKPVKFATAIYDSKENIERGRRKLIEYGNNLVKNGMPLEEVARQMAILKPMYAGNSKIGRGKFITDKNGKIKEVKADKFGDPRNQLFESVGMFEKWGVMQIDGMTPEIYKNANTKLKAQSSKAAMKDRDFDGRLAEAREARQVIDNMMNFLGKEGSDLDIAMFMISNLSSMDAPLRRAANLQYIADSVLGMKDVGKNAEYEHMIPANYMALKIIDQYKNKGGIKDQDSFYKNYNVAIIPKTMDKVLKLQGLQSSMLAGYNFEKDPSTNRYYNFLTNGFSDIVSIRDISNGKVVGPQIQYSKNAKQDQIINRAIKASQKSSDPQGITVLDFDDTLATSKSMIRYTKPDGTKGKLNAEQYAKTYEDLSELGYKWDFSEFAKVVDGKTAPLFNKALKLQSKFSPKDMFVLTARPAESAEAIHKFLTANGLNIPLKNITGLGNSTGAAKANWIAEKVGDGYNDFYFADDALQNVKAVKDMLARFDVKSKVQQAKLQFSKSLSPKMNDILESTTGVKSEKVFSDAQAKIRGAKTEYKSIIPASAQDFKGLLYNFIGKGKKGEADLAFFQKALIDPFARGISELNTSRQNSANDYKNLQKAFPEVKKTMTDKVGDTEFNNDQATRVYLWNKAGFDVPGLSKRDLKTLVDHVEANPSLQAFAEGISLISKKENGYSKPGDFWLAENITSDLLSDGSIGDARADVMAEWQANVDIMFSPENLNKIEAIYGSNFREALEDSLYRMRTGKNRPAGGGRIMNTYMNWVNNSVGAIMFFNMRSAILQTISATNYINWSFNNPAKAALAFANQPQYWKDFSMLFNSPYLKQRRSGNQRGINEAELSAAVAGAENKAKAAIAWLLKKGFLPTQLADSFAIASGGATFFRNKVKALVKEGMTQEQAEKQAFLAFQETTEVSQQSARPDMISQQQASPLGRLILSFQNTPMQYARIMNKAARDLANGRGDTKTHLSKIAYYGVAQSILFGALQSALMASMGDDEEDDFDKKKERILNGMIDSVLSGIGYGGKAVSTIKNSIREYIKQKDKGWNADHTYTILSLLSFSPPIGSKLRKIYGSIQTEQFNQGVFKKRGLTLDNPIWSGIGNVVEGVTNVPLGRIAQKMLNIDNAMDDNNSFFERAALLLGWNTWDLGIKDKDIEAVKDEIKEEKKVETKKKQKIKKQEKKKEKEEANVAVIEENKKKSKKDGICSAISKGGNRCKTKVVEGDSFCTVHEKATPNSTGIKSQCKKIKDGNKRCKMQTSSKSGFCYYHD